MSDDGSVNSETIHKLVSTYVSKTRCFYLLMPNMHICPACMYIYEHACILGIDAFASARERVRVHIYIRVAARPRVCTPATALYCSVVSSDLDGPIQARCNTEKQTTW